MICAVDPGLNGAVAFLSAGGSLDVIDMPTLALSRSGKAKREIDAHLLADEIERRKPTHAFVEGVTPMPGQGLASTFAFGKGFGVVLGVLAALDVPMTLVAPLKWKKALAVPREKDGARARASQLMPQHAHYWPRVKHDGRAESALMALYGSQR